MLRLLLILVAASLVSCNKPNPPPSGHEEKGNYTYVKDDDAAMNAAIAKAKATKGEFLEALRHPKSSYSEFYVKKPYRTPEGGEEHMWIANLREIGDDFAGTIANDAEETTEVKMGQPVRLKSTRSPTGNTSTTAASGAASPFGISTSECQNRRRQTSGRKAA